MTWIWTRVLRVFYRWAIPWIRTQILTVASPALYRWAIPGQRWMVWFIIMILSFTVADFVAQDVGLWMLSMKNEKTDSDSSVHPIIQQFVSWQKAAIWIINGQRILSTKAFTGLTLRTIWLMISVAQWRRCDQNISLQWKQNRHYSLLIWL